MGQINKFLKLVIYIITLISIPNIISVDSQSENLAQKITKLSRKDQLKAIALANARDLFYQEINLWPLNKNKINRWKETLEEIENFIKKSGSKELPPIFEKYFKMPTFSSAQSAEKVYKALGKEEDLTTLILSKIQEYNQIKNVEKEEKNTKLKNTMGFFANELKEASYKTHKVVTWRQSTEDAKELILYLTDTIFQIVYNKLKESLNPKEKTILKPKKTAQDLPVGPQKEIAEAVIKNLIEQVYQEIKNDKPVTITEAKIFAATDGMYNAHGKSKQALNEITQIAGKNSYYEYKVAKIDEFINKLTNNSNDVWEKINIAAKLKAKNWLIDKYDPQLLFIEAFEDLNNQHYKKNFKSYIKKIENLITLGAHPDILPSKEPYQYRYKGKNAIDIALENYFTFNRESEAHLKIIEIMASNISPNIKKKYHDDYTKKLNDLLKNTSNWYEPSVKGKCERYSSYITNDEKYCFYYNNTYINDYNNYVDIIDIFKD